MEHLVRFHTAEGREGHHAADSLEDALRFVERLRNTEDATNVRVFRMAEVPIEFRTYYKVEVRTSDPAEERGFTDHDGTAERVHTATTDGDSEQFDAGGRRLFSRG